MSDLEKQITELWEHRDDIAAVMTEPEDAARVREAIDLLDNGQVRVAEVVDDEIVVHQWLKQAILLLFRLTNMGVTELGPFEFRDKIPLKHNYEQAGVRVVPGAQARWGAYLAPGVVMMPSYVNIGARVGEDTMVDTWATVGSCAQIGARVHISAGAQIGGVIEPIGALPVIVEDDALVGGNTGIYEGAIIKARAVVAAGTVLTGSTPVYDLVNGRIIAPGADRPLVIPEGAVVVPGARAVTAGKGPEWGLSLATPVIVKYRDSRTDTRTELEAWIR
jgi:2,3,4,5-tetrahydropyridine-2-carboxylate N-succinyltransferase